MYPYQKRQRKKVVPPAFSYEAFSIVYDKSLKKIKKIGTTETDLTAGSGKFQQNGLVVGCIAGAIYLQVSHVGCRILADKYGIEDQSWPRPLRLVIQADRLSVHAIEWNEQFPTHRNTARALV